MYLKENRVDSLRLEEGAKREGTWRPWKEKELKRGKQIDLKLKAHTHAQSAQN
jgi:hypothetical protein